MRKPVMTKLVPAMLMAAACSATSAQVVDFVFVEDGVRDLTTMTLTDPATGLSMTVDNPRDNTLNGDNTFARILGGLFIDGGLAPTVDWTFSQDVKLVEYQLGNQDNLDLFTLAQGGTVSADNTTITVSTFAFSNTSDTFTGGTPIALTTSNHDGGGYSFARVRVELAGPSLVNDVYIARLSDEFTVPNEPGTVIPDMARIGPDFVGNWFGNVGYDVEGLNITVSNIAGASGGYADDIEFAFLELGFDDPEMVIVGATVVSATGAGWELITDSDLSVTEDSLTIDASVLGSFVSGPGQAVTVRLIPGPKAADCTGDIADDFGIIGPDGMVSFGDFLALLGLVGPCP